jgi:23S rRNA (cytosine1962-C5)-methyltransferase
MDAAAQTRRVAVRVSNDAERHVRRGHPWVFDRSVRSVSPAGEAGDLAVIFDEHRRFMAIGLLDPASPIRVKVLHHGRPAQIDGAFWRDRIAAALDRRGELVRSAQTTGYRVVHGENDGLPGVVVDRFGGVGVLKLYSTAWVPHLPDLVAAVEEVVEVESLVLRLARNAARNLARTEPTEEVRDGMALRGQSSAAPVVFLENGLRFEADVVRGQKTGFFLDQRDNRDRVRSRAAGRTVLDVFSASGGFSVAAAAGGATRVHSVDLSRGAIDAARRNMALNVDRPHVAACHHRTTVGDAAEVMAGLVAAGERYGIVVVDPPSMASRGSQVGGALRAYARLCDLALELIEPGGTLVQASCSSRVASDQLLDVVRDTAASRGVQLDRVAVTGHAADHPIGFPEGAYLSAVFAKVGGTGG